MSDARRFAMCETRVRMSVRFIDVPRMGITRSSTITKVTPQSQPDSVLRLQKLVDGLRRLGMVDGARSAGRGLEKRTTSGVFPAGRLQSSKWVVPGRSSSQGDLSDRVISPSCTSWTSETELRGTENGRSS
jgi:hypothetical protein